MAISITSTTNNYEAIRSSVMLTITNTSATADTAILSFSIPGKRVDARYYLAPYENKIVNVADYVRSVLDIKPVTDNLSDWKDSGRLVVISETTTGFELILRGGTKNAVGTPAVLSDFAARRIAPGQIDEISMVSETGDIITRVIYAPSSDFDVSGVKYSISPMGNGVRLCWVNQYGAIDYYNFSTTIQKSNSVEKNSIKLNGGWYSEVTNSSRQYTVETDAIPDEDADVIGYIIESPSVWLMNDDSSFNLIDITTKSAKTFDYSKLTQITLTYRLSNED